jgi:Flp pilus assembly protein TadD
MDVSGKEHGFEATWCESIWSRFKWEKENNSCLAARIRQAAGVTLALLLAGLAAAEQASIGSARDLLAQGRLTEAVVVLRQVVAANPHDADARMLLGTTLALQGVRGESISQLEEVVRLRPDSAQAYNTLGMVLSRFVEVKAAREAFEKSLAIDPNQAEVRVNLALQLAQSGEFNLAGEQLDRAIKLQGDTRPAAYSHYLRARTLVAEKEMGKAASELEIAVKLRPDYAEAWSDLGGVRRLEGDPKGGQQALERAVALNPDDGTAQYRLGLVCLENREPHKAIEHFKVALLHDPDDRATLYDLALAFRRDGQESEAKRIDDMLAKLIQARNKVAATGQEIGNLNDAGMALEKSGDIRAALEKYRAALDLDPTDPVLRLNYGLALCRLGRWQEGEAELREVLRLDPNNADATKALYIALDHVEKQAAPAGKASIPRPAQKE